MGRKVTIKQIANLAGVSSATVSKVLNNNGRFSEDTRKKVLKIVEEYDYRPNAVAKSLRTSKSKTIGVLVPDITNEFFAKIVLAIENYCDPRGYSVFICNSAENENKELQYFRELEIKGVDGLIYLSGSDQLLQEKTRLPIVCIDRKPKKHQVTIVTSDNVQGGYLAGNELVSKGCNNILLIRDYRDAFTTEDRVKGFIQALSEKNRTFKEKNILKVEVGIDIAKNAIELLLNNDEFKYDGIFATTDWLAYGALLALNERKLKVPEDVKIVGYDNISMVKYASITSINQNKELLGQQAAQKLIESIEQNQSYKNSIITLPVELIERESTALNISASSI
ncbi:LacI family DNA-binding transcriptional regulator [Bacillus sp. FJAT-50079]|uniref:LacI family DNA-binding transcriptional regulator n=1 Tax=Bacillus sp. FJAT-50079 TaxID=2833577 RepID=UPI001BC99161|nr:LacI family DNA-binding transcriptional regulator [Bacillus sp. FJAT-50079]MBS4207394.1 LacI family DNA-binding transcriptional regulator [Bacillus sp. FJAT-50079]